jgi:hypothetical protein
VSRLGFEEDDRVDAGTATLGIELVHPVAHTGEVERRIEAAIEVGRGQPLFERAEEQFIAAEDSWWTQHGVGSPGPSLEQRR